MVMLNVLAHTLAKITTFTHKIQPNHTTFSTFIIKIDLKNESIETHHQLIKVNGQKNEKIMCLL